MIRSCHREVAITFLPTPHLGALLTANGLVAISRLVTEQDIFRFLLFSSNRLTVRLLSVNTFLPKRGKERQ